MKEQLRLTARSRSCSEPEGSKHLKSGEMKASRAPALRTNMCESVWPSVPKQAAAAAAPHPAGEEGTVDQSDPESV